MLEQQKATSSDQSRSGTLSDDGFVATGDALDEAMWDWFAPDGEAEATAPGIQHTSIHNPPEKDSTVWELSAVGLQEPLPSQQAIDELQVSIDSEMKAANENLGTRSSSTRSIRERQSFIKASTLRE